MSPQQRTTDHGPGTIRVLPYSMADGPANMALDEAMLEASARDGSASLRFYGWTEPTLSLGYFQRIAEVRADPRWRGRPIVRRPTGGGAIWHDHELTYAIAVPPDTPHVRPNTALYRAVHGAIAEVLASRGLPARRRGEPAPGVANGPGRPILCFTGADPEDIVGMGHKWVGSAQRRRGGAVLQHGSILLARSPVVPELIGLCDVADVPRSPEDWDPPRRASDRGRPGPGALGHRPARRGAGPRAAHRAWSGTSTAAPHGPSRDEPPARPRSTPLGCPARIPLELRSWNSETIGYNEVVRFNILSMPPPTFDSLHTHRFAARRHDPGGDLSSRRGFAPRRECLDVPMTSESVLSRAAWGPRVDHGVGRDRTAGVGRRFDPVRMS